MPSAAFLILLSSLFISCKEDVETDNEYANWKERNEQFLATLVNDSLQQPGWQRYKMYSLDQTSEGEASEYIYAKQIVSGESTVMPSVSFAFLLKYKESPTKSATSSTSIFW